MALTCLLSTTLGTPGCRDLPIKTELLQLILDQYFSTFKNSRPTKNDKKYSMPFSVFYDAKDHRFFLIFQI